MTSIAAITRSRRNRRGGNNTLLRVLAADNDLDQDPPALTLYAAKAGTVTWDFHSTTTPPTPGGGDIDTGSFAVIGGANYLEFTLAAGTGYLHLRHSEAISSLTLTYPDGTAITSPASATFPTYVGNNTAGDNTNGVTLQWPVGHDVGDIGVIILGANGNGDVLDTLTGWTLLGEFNETSTSGFPRLGIYTKTAESDAEPNVSVPDAGSMNVGQMIAIRGADTVALLGTATYDAGTDISFAAGTPGQDNTLVLGILMEYINEIVANPGFANADLANLTYRDGFGGVSGGDCSINYFTGEKATAAAIGATTATVASTNPCIGVHLQCFLA